jgi:hypothetical protein
MANLLGQVTIPASGKVQLSTGIQQPGVSVGAGVGGPQVGNIFCQTLQIQNNGSHVMRCGDVTVSATRGIALQPATSPPGGGSDNLSGFINYGTYLSDWWVAGTAGDVCDFLYIQ